MHPLDKITYESIVKSSAKSQVLKLVEFLAGTKDLTEDSVVSIFKMDMLTTVGRMTVSKGEKRQPQQYESNDYHVSCSFECEDLFKWILLESLDSDDPVAKYMDLKKTAFSVLRQKYENNAVVLGQSISTLKKRDGILS